MEKSLRHFTRRRAGASALAFTILANLAPFAALAGASLTMASPALADNQPSRAATAKTPPLNDGLPEPGFTISHSDTAIVITDPQNDFLSPDGVTWGVVGKNVEANGTVENDAGQRQK